jgi:IclR family acetate operon transcriptional repressor
MTNDRGGLSASLLRGASAKVYLASMSQAELDELAARYGPEERDRLALRRGEIPAVRERGFATSRGELLAGGAAIAAPIYNAAGEVFASMTVSGPVQRITPSFMAKIAPLLREGTLAISAQLGYIPDSG